MQMKEFIAKSKKYLEVSNETSESTMEDDDTVLNCNKGDDDKYCPATTREMFNMNCHIQENIHTTIKEPKNRWVLLRSGDVNCINAVTKLLNAQSSKVQALKKVIKALTDSHLNEIIEIQNQL